jgi:hypothetical protein
MPREPRRGRPLPIAVDRRGTAASLAAVMQAMAEREEVGSLLVWIAGLATSDLGPFEATLARLPVPASGAFFPKLIVGPTLLAQGAIVIGLPAAYPPVCVARLSDPHTALADRVASLPDMPSAALLLVLADGWAPEIRSLVHTVFEEFGTGVQVMGGGAGSLERPDLPCVFTNDGLLANAALLQAFPWPDGIGIGLAHGWRTMSPPFKVTASDGHVIREIDHEPATTMYDRILAGLPTPPARDCSLPELMSRHPLGLRRLDAEPVIRDPMRLASDGAGIVCLSAVPVGTFVHVMRSDARAMVRAARQADSNASRALGQRSPILRLVFDCVSREAFLNSRFGEELDVFADGVPTVGALTIGEIAGEGEQYLEYHNKSIVVTQLAGGSTA